MLTLNKNQTSLNDVSGNGIIDKVIHQGEEWRVRANGSFWSARSTKPANFQPGDRVCIVGRQNTTLLVDAA
jgi:membrane protein implicated in regulation of membrane protease activity